MPQETRTNPHRDPAFDSVGFIMDVEGGTIDADAYVAGMAQMVAHGLAFSLQGSWGRAAAAMIERGYISPEGRQFKDGDGEDIE